MAASHKRSLLLIDDSHEDLFLVKRLLARAGITHPIVTVDAGEEAIVFLRACILPAAHELLPLIIFCDVKMPGQNGFEVLEWIRRDRALDGVPVYMLSGADLETDRAKAIGLGATGYVAKFPTPDALKAMIESAEQAGERLGGRS